MYADHVALLHTLRSSNCCLVGFCQHLIDCFLCKSMYDQSHLTLGRAAGSRPHATPTSKGAKNMHAAVIFLGVQCQIHLPMHDRVSLCSVHESTLRKWYSCHSCTGASTVSACPCSYEPQTFIRCKWCTHCTHICSTQAARGDTDANFTHRVLLVQLKHAHAQPHSPCHCPRYHLLHAAPRTAHAPAPALLLLVQRRHILWRRRDQPFGSHGHQALHVGLHKRRQRRRTPCDLLRPTCRRLVVAVLQRLPRLHLERRMLPASHVSCATGGFLPASHALTIDAATATAATAGAAARATAAGAAARAVERRSLPAVVLPGVVLGA